MLVLPYCAARQPPRAASDQPLRRVSVVVQLELLGAATPDSFFFAVGSVGRSGSRSGDVGMSGKFVGRRTVALGKSAKILSRICSRIIFDLIRFRSRPNLRSLMRDYQIVYCTMRCKAGRVLGF